MKITLTKGNIASGKTTWAKEQVDAGGGSVVNINKDDLRAMLHNSKSTKAREDFVIQVQESIIETALTEGKDVIVSDTNLNPSHLERITAKFGDRAEVVVNDSFLQVSVEECIARDAKRDNPIGESAIRQQYNRYIRKEPEPLPEFDNLDSCVVFDVDGTLTMGPHDRSPYEWGKVGNDLPRKSIASMARNYYIELLTPVLIVSGRDESCRAETEEWLRDNHIEYNELHMRKTGDNRPDDIIKEEILDNVILPQYNIELWVDDRLKVCKMLYKRGVPLLRVGDPEANF